MTRAQLKELKLALDKENFTETSLNEATSAVTNAHIVADIIAHVRKAVLKTPLFNHDERVVAAFSKLIAAHRFNKMQLDLLEKIKTYMLHESILNTETLKPRYLKWMVVLPGLTRSLAERSLTLFGRSILTFMKEPHNEHS